MQQHSPLANNPPLEGSFARGEASRLKEYTREKRDLRKRGFDPAEGVRSW